MSTWFSRPGVMLGKNWLAGTIQVTIETYKDDIRKELNMNRYVRIAMIAVVLVVLLGSSVGFASANSKDTYQYEGAMTSPPYTCENGQIIIEEFAYFADVTNFYTTDGELFMVEEDFLQTGKLYLEDEPDKVIYYENEHWKNMTKPSGRMQSSGIVMKITIPGHGMVFQDIGHYIFEYDPVAGHVVPTFFAGQHEFFDPALYPEGWDYSVPCKYLTSLP